MESLLFFISITLFVSISSEASSYKYKHKFNAIFNFGDSISDTGNSLIAGDSPDLSYLRKLPYGQTFFGRPTGRGSDGRLIVDFLTEAFGLPYLPPYLAHTHPGAGVNFAVAGATALDSELFLRRKVWTNDSLTVQVGWFKEVKKSLCLTQQDCDSFMKKTLFLVGEIGWNDYNLGFFSGETIQEVKALVPPVVEAIIKATTALIEEGAAEVVVGGLLPLGCSTVFLTLFRSSKESDYDSLGCLTAFNAFSELHNSRLKALLEIPQKEYPHAKIVYMDYFGATMRFVRYPQRYGLNKETILMTCCGGGGPNNFNPAAWCGTNGSTTCEDPSLYANWDGLHLTEAAYRIIAGALLNACFTNPPLLHHPPSKFI